eukprot:7441423-Pyramimonas_sp.AAC.1
MRKWREDGEEEDGYKEEEGDHLSSGMQAVPQGHDAGAAVDRLRRGHAEPAAALRDGGHQRGVQRGVEHLRAVVQRRCRERGGREEARAGGVRSTTNSRLPSLDA